MFLKFYLVTGGTTTTNVLDSTEIYAGVEWNIVESAVLPYATVWSQITYFDEKILLFGKFITRKKCLSMPSFFTYF